MAPMAALIAALAIGFINATIGFVLKVMTFPLTLVTLGLFWLVINALMLELASALVPGFHVRGFFAAFVGAIVLSLVNMLLKAIVMPKDRSVAISRSPRLPESATANPSIVPLLAA